MCFLSEFFAFWSNFIRFVSSSIDHLLYSITSRLEKEIIVLEKSQEKVFNFEAKNLYEP